MRLLFSKWLLPEDRVVVHLSDFPPLVITLNEIEVVHLERVQFGLKNFDMVFVFSDLCVLSLPLCRLAVTSAQYETRHSHQHGPDGAARERERLA